MIARQWYSASDDCVTIRSNTSYSGCDRNHCVITSPRTSRSRAFVAENTFNPIRASLSTVHTLPYPAQRLIVVALERPKKTYETHLSLLSIAVAAVACGGNETSHPTCTGDGWVCVDTACSCTAGADCKTECFDSACAS